MAQGRIDLIRPWPIFTFLKSATFHLFRLCSGPGGRLLLSSARLAKTEPRSSGDNRGSASDEEASKYCGV